MTSPYNRQAADQWIAGVLRDRIGLSLGLVRDASDRLAISIEGTECLIVFEGNFDWRPGEACKIPCSRLAVDSLQVEGLSSMDLVLPGLAEAPRQLVVRRERTLVVRYDLLGMMAWMLSRAEEVGCVKSDKYDRFPLVASHAYRHSYFDRPVVDEWIQVLRALIRSLLPSVRLVAQRFNIALSHDVDEPARYAFRRPRRLASAVATDLLQRRAWRDVLSVPAIRVDARQSLSPRDPYNTFSWLLREAEARSLRSAFYFMSGKTVLARDSDYEIGHPAIRSLIREISHRGHEIGLHPSFGTFRDPDELTREAERLRLVCLQEGVDQEKWGSRMHFLRWETPTTAHGLSAADMAYDSTLGFAEQPGFRCGTCHEYPMFDPVARRVIDLRARPLIAMDVSVTSSSYLNLGHRDGALQAFKRIKDACRRVEGTFALLWHNSEVVSEPQRDLFRAVLDA